ncbi:hypothetical protein [Chromobacterium subtsugae]|uniref:hypothetical protein n=1 Tax=Chromobacterium subtsugae TaxID=251747 RepID=UPI000B30816A|nr:hypothetical protein [Chromobacterium subtsugae]
MTVSVRQMVLQRRAWRVRKTPPDRRREEGRAFLQDLARMLGEMEIRRRVDGDVVQGER